MKITLRKWAEQNYTPAPSNWVLRSWVREGQIYPPPEMVGNSYYIEDTARRIAPENAQRLSLVERLKRAA